MAGAGACVAAGLGVGWVLTELTVRKARPAAGDGGSEQESDPARMPLQAGGGGTHYDITLWLSPLRSAGGGLVISMTWLRLGLTAASVTIPIPAEIELRRRRLDVWPT